MPITKELDNINELENAGFDHKQSKILAKIIEQSHADSHESLKEFFRNELSNQISGIDNKLSNQINGIDNKLSNQINGLDSKLSNEIKSLEIRMMASQKDLLIKIFGIIVGSLTVAVTILKLFP